MRSPSRSAVPLASVGIIGLGLVPTLGGPDLPLHWLMTAAMTGFGVLLTLRHRLQRREPPLAPVAQVAARQAGRAVLWISGVITLLVLGIVVLQAIHGGPIAAWSLLLPALGLLWLASLGVQSLRWPADAEQANATSEERPSRRPPSWERRTPPGPDSSQNGPGRHARA